MTFQIRKISRATTNNIAGEFWLLESSANECCAEIWPAHGFNCVRWRCAEVDWLYQTPDLLSEVQPTRSGVPILFPFPNRIRGGHFLWRGQAYQLPKNDPAVKNAIHGFACRNPWRIIAKGADMSCAWLTGEFHGARDASNQRSYWPADYRMRLTWRLLTDRLSLTFEIDNPDSVDLPAGLGLHPYFTLHDSEETHIQVAADRYWHLQENLPTGKTAPVGDDRDLRNLRPLAGLELDDALTSIRFPAAAGNTLPAVATIRHLSVNRSLSIYCSRGFRELVVYTPPHRRAICVEPYTCVTDAVNLASRGFDTGLRVLQPGEQWTGAVTFKIHSEL